MHRASHCRAASKSRPAPTPTNRCTTSDGDVEKACPLTSAPGGTPRPCVRPCRTRRPSEHGLLRLRRRWLEKWGPWLTASPWAGLDALHVSMPWTIITHMRCSLRRLADRIRFAANLTGRWRECGDVSGCGCRLAERNGRNVWQGIFRFVRLADFFF